MKQKDKYLERVCRDFFAGQMTLRDCREDVKEYMKEYPTAKQNLGSRRDDRRFFDAALAIKLCTLKESYSVGIFEEYLKACGYDVRIETLGNDAVGEIFLDYNWVEIEDRFLPKPKKVAWNKEFPFPEKMGNLVVSLKQAIRTEGKVPLLVLELKTRGIDESGKIEGIRKWFDLAHEWIVRGFTDLTTPEIQKIWERKDNA